MNRSNITNPENFSKGCQYCQSGKWLCLFLTYRCQADCFFCPAPFHDDRIVTEFGPSLDLVLKGMETSDFMGVAFSGGDCFMVPDRLLHWQTVIHSVYPDLYYWVYTNGLSVTPDILQKLVQNGMHEIRFNLAATGYIHPKVWENLEQAIQIFAHVAVEIPSIPAHYNSLCEILPRLYETGVHYLNLHEYLLPMNDNNAHQTCFNVTDQLKYDPQSLENTSKIIDYCVQNKLDIVINNCSIQQKEQQMLHRRLFWANRSKNSWERVTDDGLLETYCQLTYKEELLKNKFESIPDSAFQLPTIKKHDDKMLHVLFKPPLSFKGARSIVSVSEISNSR